MFNLQIERDIEEIFSESAIPRNISFGNVLITGATGMLGGYLAESLLIFKQKGYFNIGEIYIVGRGLSVRCAEIQKIASGFLHLVDLESLPIFLQTKNIDSFIHAASPASFENVGKNMLGLFETNIGMTKMLLERISDESTNFFFFSSGDVYGPEPKFPTSEVDFSGFDPAQSRHLYGEFKRAAESLMYIYSQKVTANYVALRIYHTFGPGLRIDDSRIFGEVLKTLVTKTKFHWKSNGSVRRNFLYTKDLLRAILFTSNLSGFNAFNVAGDSAITISEFVECARQLSNDEVFPYPPENGDFPITHIQTGNADTSKLRSRGWVPTVDPKEAISRTLESKVNKKK